MANPNDIQQELLRLVRVPAGELAGERGAAALLPRVSSPAEAALNDNGAAGGEGQSSSSPAAELARQLEALKRQMGAVEEISKRQAEQLEKNTRAVVESAAQAGRGAGGVAQEIVSTVRGAGGLGVLGSPLVGLLSRLFRRGNDAAPAPPALAASGLASPLSEDLALPTRGSGLTQVSYRADGVPRPVPSVTPAAVSPANFTIQVQTMDSRSFLDNSDQIARAVREAMLHSHALNDVVGEM